MLTVIDLSYMELLSFKEKKKDSNHVPVNFWKSSKA